MLLAGGAAAGSVRSAADRGAARCAGVLHGAAGRRPGGDGRRWRLRLWAAASGRADTDFTAKLVDVAPDGYPRNLCDGIVRARYRNGTDQPTPVRPGEPIEYIIAVGPTSNVFLAGHRVRLEISSSNFPRYDRNPNTGNADGAPRAGAAGKLLFRDTAHASHVLLPVVA